MKSAPHTLRLRIHLLLLTAALFLTSCSRPILPSIVTQEEVPPPADFTITICENVFSSFLYGEVPERELVFLNTEKHIALRPTDIIFDENNDSSIWTLVTLRDLVPGKSYTFRYEIIGDDGALFRTETFTFSPDSPRYTTWIREEINPEGRKPLSTGTWQVRVLVNGVVLDTKQFSLLSSNPGQDISNKEYRWKDFSFRYPGYCVIEEDSDVTGENGKIFRLVKLTVSGKHRIGIFLYFDDDWQPPVADMEDQDMLNLMLGLPMALNQAEPAGADAVALSVGSIELIDGFGLSARFVITKPGSNSFSSLECFHRSVGKKMFFGILFTQGVKGKGSDTPEYYRLIRDAYGIIRSISIPGLTGETAEQGS
ncbi:MAG: hypothetical protein Kow0089_24160 [Desulfobulbaceae bacterium]